MQQLCKWLLLPLSSENYNAGGVILRVMALHFKGFSKFYIITCVNVHIPTSIYI